MQMLTKTVIIVAIKRPSWGIASAF